MGWIDTLLAIGSTPDWISPTISLAEDYLGGMEPVFIDVPPGLSGRAIIRHLRRNGVRVGNGPMMHRGRLLVNVDDTDRARELLERI